MIEKLVKKYIPMLVKNNMSMYRHFFIKMKKTPYVESTVDTKENTNMLSYVISVVVLLDRERDKVDIQDYLMIQFWNQVLVGLFYEIYFTEDLHRRSVKIFDALHEISDKLPSIFGRDLLDEFRILHKEIYDINHKMRAVLFSLGSTDVVNDVE